jgi:putative NADH-flavin reductase
MPPRVLLLGGHGKVSLLMTPKLVSRSWNVTSVVRNPEHKRDILEAGKNGPGKVDVLVASLEEVKSDADAQKILDQVKPDWVIWSAGELFSLSHPLHFSSSLSPYD